MSLCYMYMQLAIDKLNIVIHILMKTWYSYALHVHTFSGEPELTAYHCCIVDAKRVVADCSPASIETNLDTSRVRTSAIHETNLTISTCGVGAYIVKQSYNIMTCILAEVCIAELCTCRLLGYYLEWVDGYVVQATKHAWGSS